ncbi:MAG: hypothetical protein M1826_003965 [Phylliscum demangeonii]|nr:MAG: hypothetical protein M1826_003965 [Phylliscum demangeonii]
MFKAGANQVRSLLLAVCIPYCSAGVAATTKLTEKRLAGPLPKFDGFSPPKTSASLPQDLANILPQSTAGSIRVPPLTPDKVAEFSALFERTGPQNGFLPGGQAKQIFERARLPNDVLGKIWTLADTRQAGALSLPEFVVAMHLLASYKTGAMTVVPPILPPGFFDAAGRMSSQQQQQPQQQPRSPTASLVRTHTNIAPGVGIIPRQFSGSSMQRPPSSLSNANPGNQSLPAQGAASDWIVNPRDKAQWDNVFATVDQASKGYITGEEAVKFFGNSKLPAEMLAQIWDLACVSSNGQLSKDEFSVAMYLIRQQRSAPDGVNALPAVLPPSLIPPSMRSLAQPVAQPASATPAPLKSMPRSASEDLFELDSFSSPAPFEAQSTGGSFSANLDSPKGAQPQELPPASSHQARQSSVFKPFVPSSSFGQNMVATNYTGGSASTPNRAPQEPRSMGAMDDLLGDNDPEVSKKLTAETTEIGNLSNQVNGLSAQLQEVELKKSSLKSDLSTLAQQKREFEQRLAELRAAYEQEVQAVRALEEQVNSCRNESKKVLRDTAMIEGSYEDLKNQHRQATSALEADQRENAMLKDKIRTLNAEMEVLKPQLEKIRSEARQHKGLVAINKKQLSTTESDRNRLRTEIDEAEASASREMPSVAEEKATPLHASAPDVISPAASVASPSTNPFFRSMPAEDSATPSSAGPFGSPADAPLQLDQSAFDDVFGPSFSSPKSSAPPPPTTFRGDSSPPAMPSGPADFEPFMQSTGSGDESASPPGFANHGSSRFDLPAGLAPESQRASSLLSHRGLPPKNTSSTLADPVASTEKEAGRTSSTDRASPFGEGANWEMISASDLEKSMDSHLKVDLSRQDDVTALRGVSANAKGPAGGSATAGDSPNFSPFTGPSQARAVMPGAFPGEQNSMGIITPVRGRTPAPAGETSKLRNSTDLDSASRDLTPKAELERRPTAKDDFDAAFAEFEAPKLAQSAQANGFAPTTHVEPGAPPKIDTEFPPIQELELDDDSGSEAERRFDDNFTPVGSQHRRDGLDRDPLDDAHLHPPRPATLQPTFSERGPLPSPGAEMSPPSYQQTVNATESRLESGAHDARFPPEFSGLLPSREDPTQEPHSIPALSSGGATVAQPVQMTSAALTSLPLNAAPPAAITPPETYHLAPSYLRPNHKQSSPLLGQVSSPPSTMTTTTGPVAAADEFDHEFADLADAKESDDKDDHPFELSVSEHAHFDEFNPVFDSPPTAKTGMASNAQS